MLGQDYTTLASSASACPLTPSSTPSATSLSSSFATTISEATSILPGPTNTVPTGYALPPSMAQTVPSTKAMAGAGLAFELVLLVIAAAVVFFLRFSGMREEVKPHSTQHFADGGNELDLVSPTRHA